MCCLDFPAELVWEVPAPPGGVCAGEAGKSDGSDQALQILVFCSESLKKRGD